MPTWASPCPPFLPAALPGVPGMRESRPRCSALRTSALMRLASAWYWRRRRNWLRDSGRGGEDTVARGMGAEALQWDERVGDAMKPSPTSPSPSNLGMLVSRLCERGGSRMGKNKAGR